MKNFENVWKAFLLTEGMKTPEELPEDVGLLIDTSDSPENIEFTYINLHTGSPSDEPRGKLRISNLPSEMADYYGKCYGAWVVSYVQAVSGWGPMLYDVAIEWASMRGSGIGLAPDRQSVSDDAYEVWDKYMKTRNDVEVKQLDNSENELTPDETDNCMQGSAVTSASKKGVEWHETPISKVYQKKNPSMIKALQSAGKLVFNEGDI